MAILTEKQLREIRNRMTADNRALDWDKPGINPAIQTIEDWFEANRVSLSRAIDTATQPGFTLSATRKRRLVSYWFLQRFGRDSI